MFKRFKESLQIQLLIMARTLFLIMDLMITTFADEWFGFVDVKVDYL